MSATGLAKAQIRNLDKKDTAPITCMFNPKELSFAKQNGWTRNSVKGQNVPPFDFAGGQATQLQMQLFFDTYETKQDVRKAYTSKIWQLMMVQYGRKDAKTGKSSPPSVQFEWGEGTLWSFRAVITGITEKFTLFEADGTPVRATLDVTFQEIQDPRSLPNQNPTSGGSGGERVWTVRSGDTLSWIAYSEYGDAGMWRLIAAANGLTQVRRLRPGTVLEIPNA